MDFTWLNTMQPCLFSASHINKNNCGSPGASYGRRTVEHYELDYIIWGEGHILTDGAGIPATKGSLFFRRPGMVVEGIAPYHCYYIRFDLQNIDPAENMEDSRELLHNFPYCFPPVMNISNTSFMESMFSEIYNAYILHSDVLQFITRTYLMQILLHMYNQWTSKSRFEVLRSSLRKNSGVILSIKEQMEKEPQSPYTLDRLAESAGLSKYFFCRIFSELIGETPIDYVNRCRINLAKRLLTETEKSVKDIMFTCGFDNEAHFFRLFKRQAMVSPSAYRQSNRAWRTQDK